MNFDLGLVNLDLSSTGTVDFAGIVERTFEELGKRPAPMKEPLFTLHRPSSGEDLDAFLKAEQNMLRLGRRAAVVVIPKGFSEYVRSGSLASSVLGSGATPPRQEGDAILVYYTKGSDASELASSIVEQVLARVNQEVLAQAGLFRSEETIPVETRFVGGKEIRYVDFLLPGVILMGFFTNGLFGVPGAILFSRDRRILKSYWVTPLSVRRYLAGFSLGHLSLCSIQFILLVLIGRFAFAARVSFAQPIAALYLLLGAVTFMAFGFLIAAVVRTANAGLALANLLNLPMMFLSGLFFQVGGLPYFLKVVVYANPVSYLAEGLRASLGVGTGQFAPTLTLVVPLAWVAICVLIASRRLSWDVAR
jgi:ABC-2 type transport system permease protein